MPEKYHIKMRPVPPRLPRIGKYGIVDWREDCAMCHNCVKKACVYDRYQLEMNYIRNLGDVDALFFDCMGCFSCVQDCTKDLLCLSVNPEYERLGNSYWTPDIIRTTWFQAETAKIPVSGSGYGGPFTGPGFDSMWTDMSEIVRPTRDGIHGREYISTSVDVGTKPPFLTFDEGKLADAIPMLVALPMPLIIDMSPSDYSLPKLERIKAAAAERTGLIAIIDARDWSLQSDDFDQYLPNLAFYLSPGAPEPPREVLRKTRLVEIPDDSNVTKRIRELRHINPTIVVSIRVELNSRGVHRAIELAVGEADVVHVMADLNGNEIGVENPQFIKDMIHQIHTSLVKSGKRDEVTLMAGGGIGLPEHMAKALICGADLVTIELPLMIALECHLCDICKPGYPCPAKLDHIDFDYGVGRITNLIAAWHGQLIEVLGAMGIREVRRLRGEIGRALLFEDLEEENFGKLFGQRKRS